MVSKPSFVVRSEIITFLPAYTTPWEADGDGTRVIPPNSGHTRMPPS